MSGYKGKVQKLLSSASIGIGDKIRVEKAGSVYEGVLMPRTELGDPNHIVLKLSSGYNAGIKLGKGVKLMKLEKGKPPRLSIAPLKIKRDPSKPDVSIVGTGGTIASRVDYRTGAVYPAFTPEEIYSAVPELADLANIRVIEACNVFSEHMTPKLWVKVGNAIAKELNAGASGVVVAHGTDTMGYTAAALSFILKNLFRPVVLVGSQRSSDRPSSDAALNLIGAVTVAGKSDIAEVCVVMHGSTEDDFCLIHRGTKVRKCHTSRRDAFQTINDTPFGMVKGGELKLFREDYNHAKLKGRIRLDAKFEPKVALIKAFPGMRADIIDSLLSAGYKGIILEGTGLGHIGKYCFQPIKKAVRRGIFVGMCSQCLYGRVNMKVYDTGRDLLRLGVVPLEDMLPETAFVKLSWALGRTKDLNHVKRIMLSNTTGEITSRSIINRIHFNPFSS